VRRGWRGSNPDRPPRRSRECTLHSIQWIANLPIARANLYDSSTTAFIRSKALVFTRSQAPRLYLLPDMLHTFFRAVAKVPTRMLLPSMKSVLASLWHSQNRVQQRGHTHCCSLSLSCYALRVESVRRTQDESFINHPNPTRPLHFPHTLPRKNLVAAEGLLDKVVGPRVEAAKDAQLVRVGRHLLHEAST
jgi:hypothetical protein